MHHMHALSSALSMTEVKGHLSIFFRSTYISSTAKTFYFIKKKNFEQLLHSVETMLQSLLIYVIKCIFFLYIYIVGHFRLKNMLLCTTG